MKSIFGVCMMSSSMVLIASLSGAQPAPAALPGRPAPPAPSDQGAPGPTAPRDAEVAPPSGSPAGGPLAPRPAAAFPSAQPPASSQPTATPTEPAPNGSTTKASPVPVPAPAVPAPPAAKPPRITFTPYGYVKLQASYDTARTAYGDIAFFVQPASRPGGGEKELGFSARETRLGLKVSGDVIRGITGTAQVEADWFEEAATSNKYSPRLRLAFLDLGLGDGWSIRAGQDWDLFVSIHPLTTDPGILGGTGHLYMRRPQLRITKAFNFNTTDSLTFKVAGAHGRSQDVDSDGQIDADAASVPIVEGNVTLAAQLLGTKATQLGLSAAYGEEKVRLPLATSTTTPNHSTTFQSVLLHASLRFPLSSFLTLQGTAFWGKNLDQYWGGILQGINTSTERAIESVGGWGQVVAEFSPEWTVSGGYGVDDPVNDDIPKSGRTFNSRTFGNIFFKLTPEATVVAEYGYLKTRFASEATQSDHRLALAFQYNF